jgi:hypothetical protein
MNVIADIRVVFRTRIGARAFFSQPTVAETARSVDAARDRDHGIEVGAERAEQP